MIGNDTIESTAEEMGIRFQGGQTDAGLTMGLGVEEVLPKDLVRAYGTMANKGMLVPQTVILKVEDNDGEVLIDRTTNPDKGTRALDNETAAIVTDILAGNTNPDENPYWGKFRIMSGGERRPATLKTGTNNDALDLSAYGYIAAPTQKGRANGEYALVVGAWNGNSDNSPMSSAADPLFSIDVTTYVWAGFLKDATKGWAINDFKLPDSLVERAVDPWTGLAAAGAKRVGEYFRPGTEPAENLPAEERCGTAVLRTAGFEDEHPAWMIANESWMKRAAKGPGVRGRQGTATSYFYNFAFNPYGKSWGPLMGKGAGCALPSESPSIDPCASFDPLASVDPSASPIVCPSPSASPSDAAEPGADTRTHARADTGADTRADARAHAGADTGADTRAHARADTGADTGTHARPLTRPGRRLRVARRPRRAALAPRPPRSCEGVRRARPQGRRRCR